MSIDVIRQFGATLREEHECDHRSHGCLGYTATDSKQSLTSVLEQVATNMFAAYGRPSAPPKTDRIISQSLGDFEQFVRLLAELKFMPVTGFETTDYESSGRVHLRLDIDGDIQTAVELARIAGGLDVTLSFYILHTAPYYGNMNFETGVFARNESLVSLYRELQDLGHEVGLHIDALLLGTSGQVDGNLAVQEELKWLRNNGLQINGTFPHNSVSTYGAVNSAIYKNHGISLSQPSSYFCLEKNGFAARLGELDMEELGLLYDGHRHIYAFCDWYFSLLRGDIWHVARSGSRGKTDPMKRAHTKGDSLLLTSGQVETLVKGLDPTTQNLYFALHPLAFGRRKSVNEWD